MPETIAEGKRGFYTHLRTGRYLLEICADVRIIAIPAHLDLGGEADVVD
jgi:hypothetical protein